MKLGDGNLSLGNDKAARVELGKALLAEAALGGGRSTAL